MLTPFFFGTDLMMKSLSNLIFITNSHGNMFERDFILKMMLKKKSEKNGIMFDRDFILKMMPPKKKLNILRKRDDVFECLSGMLSNISLSLSLSLNVYIYMYINLQISDATFK